jgi:hypothetical protein
MRRGRRALKSMGIRCLVVNMVHRAPTRIHAFFMLVCDRRVRGVSKVVAPKRSRNSDKIRVYLTVFSYTSAATR